MRVLLDTNILLRAVHRTHPQYRETRDAIRTLAARGGTFCCASQNFIEFWVVCTRSVEQNGLGLSSESANRILTRLELVIARLTDDGDHVYPEWRRLIAEHGIVGKSSHDARLAATMLSHGVSDILTYDQAGFNRFPEINVLSPAGMASTRLG